MSFQLICSDIDGTLLNKNRELSAATINTVKALNSLYDFILISSRMPAAMRHLQTQLAIEDQPLIAYNGGLIIDQNRILSSTEITLSHLEKIIEFNQENSKVHLSLYQRDDWYVPSMDYWAEREQNNTKVKPQILGNNKVLKKWKKTKFGAHKLMCMGEERAINQLFEYLNHAFVNELHLYRSKPTYIEIAPKEISKLTAIDLLLKEKYLLDRSQVMAFGDNFNDIEMLKNVGMGIAVKNAKEEVKAVAKAITSAAKEDGVAKYLRSEFLKHL
ncbi:MAG: Cof-type HAD-IIB family hydrolase [Psychroflexus maritimus]